MPTERLQHNVVEANSVQFNNDFAGPGVDDGMHLQGTSKSFINSVSAQAWVKCFHIFRRNVKHGPFFSVSIGI